MKKWQAGDGPAPYPSTLEISRNGSGTGRLVQCVWIWFLDDSLLSFTNYDMKSTLVIAFNGGAYGTYLEWALNNLINDIEIKVPFTSRGNSHQSMLGNHLGNMQQFDAYVKGDSDFVTARLHPKTSADESLQENLEFLLDNTQHVIMLYPDRQHELMCVCNYMTKIWLGDPYDGAMAYMNPHDIYQGYGIDPGTDLRKIPNWIRREHMSFNLFDSWHDQVEWYFPDQWQDDRAMVITTKELLDDFENVLLRIQDFWNRPYRRNVADMMPYHRDMLALQPHLGKDRLCADIVQCVINDNGDLDYGDICPVSQAWIQYQLRLQGYELQCDGLNDFPTNTQILKSLVYRA